MTIEKALEVMGNAVIFLNEIRADNFDDPGKVEIFHYSDRFSMDVSHNGIAWSLIANMLPETSEEDSEEKEGNC